MKVLLISPTRATDPPGGDVTYTESLLASPPPGVQYVPYDEALQEGMLQEHGRRSSLIRAWSTKRRIVKEPALLAACRVVDWFRRRRILFWEPFRFFSVVPGEFDLIHVHVFDVGFVGKLPCPLVMSAGGPVDWLYTDARQYGARRVRWMAAVDEALARILKVNRSAGASPQAGSIITYTKEAKQWLAGAGRRSVVPIEVVPTFVQTAERRPSRPRPSRVGFVARNFVHKGGPMVLEAFRQVKIVRPDAELMVVGCDEAAASCGDAPSGVTWMPYVPQQQLLDEIMPSFDLLVYPTEYDYLPCFTLLEAMARGIPIAATDYRAMREILGDEAGLVSPVKDVDGLARNITKLLDADLNERMSILAYDRFKRKYSSETVRHELGRVYQIVVNRARATAAVASPDEE